MATATEKITIALTPELAGFVRQFVESGVYASTSEVVRAAVREWKERRDLPGYTAEELRGLVREGIDSGPGRHATMADVRAEALRRFEAAKSRG
ncbi:MAG: type II toxin-antitoxin system ParD family antitoxin [Alphaproteobacteria bacterium]|nr:type II toxin-antitoxin system ParD family antitoxin [Alphaproteobacteria bacterium]